MRSRILGACAPALLVAASLLAPAPAHAASCAPPAAAGGDWPSYGHDTANTRSQPEEHVLGPTTVGGVHAKWTFDATDTLGAGEVDSTPVVADGCVFVMSSVTRAAQLFAINADTGEQVWTSGPLAGDSAALGGPAVGSVAVAGGRVYALVSKPGHPFVVVYDESGQRLWGGGSSAPANTADGFVDDQPNSFINASPVVIPGPAGGHDLLFVGFAVEENVVGGRGGWSIFDAVTGTRLAHEFTIGNADYAAPSYGASVWATPVAAGGYVYAGTGNPSSARHEARNADSILKIDVRDPASPTFGTIVAAYHGDPESYVGALRNQPACDTAPDAVKVLGSWSVTCVQLDLDFGASPNLFSDRAGHLLVGELQKSGNYHALYADTMGRAWTATMGAPEFAFNGASTAVADGSAVFGVSTPGGVMQARDVADGRLVWAGPVGDGAHYQSTSYANGVTYVTDGYGFLDAFDAATGLPLLKRNLGLDTGGPEANVGSGGVAIARNRLFVANGTHVVSYGL